MSFKTISYNLLANSLVIILMEQLGKEIGLKSLACIKASCFRIKVIKKVDSAIIKIINETIKVLNNDIPTSFTKSILKPSGTWVLYDGKLCTTSSISSKEKVGSS